MNLLIVDIVMTCISFVQASALDLREQPLGEKQSNYRMNKRGGEISCGRGEGGGEGCYMPSADEQPGTSALSSSSDRSRNRIVNWLLNSFNSCTHPLHFVGFKNYMLN
ncbi:uncharacterized protein LOC142350989 [Convolutriloba macropyga]|uniref:uncharacterized protein LOC142350989 n=1 Tax=Convolutriloba macropyga TaxID=536237 RepID=UPI003F520C57